MTIDALLNGKLMNQPTQRTSKNGNAFTTCRIRVAGAGVGESDSLLVNVIAFSNTTQAALLALDVGEAVSLAGSLKAGIWQAQDGTTRPSLDMTASAVLTPYSIAKKRRAALGDQERPQEGRRRDQRPPDPLLREHDLDDALPLA